MSKHVCYVEDAGEDSGSSVVEGIESTRRYAVSEAPEPYKSNTSKSRGDKRYSNRRTDSSPSDGVPEYNDSPRRADRARREYEREQRDKDRRRKERKQKEAAEQQQRKVRAEAKAAKDRETKDREAKVREAKPARKTRPTSLTQSRTEPVVQQYRRGHVEDPSCYGVQQPAVSGMRPRAQTRPNSYYPGQTATTPISRGGWHHPQHSQPSFPVGSFPPPPMYPGAQSPSIVGAPPSPGPGVGTPGFFDMASHQASAHLRNRFERPASSIGFRQQPPPPPSNFGYPQDDFEDEPDPRLARRVSRSKKHQQQNDEDRRRMPPPDNIPRPKSALPPTTPFRPPPQQSLTRQKSRTPSRPPVARSRVGFVDQQGYDDDDFGGSPGLFNDMSPEHFDRRTALARTRRGSVAYEQPGVDIVTARSRRDSFMGPDRSLGSGGVSLDEDKYLDALRYQDDMNGGPAMPLTAETLRKASTRTGGSSRSTRSSGSRDESEYKRSNTTGLTRSSSSDTDNVTIKVSGSAVVRVPGAEIQCADGGEITFTSRTGGSRVGSDRASSVYQLEDMRSRGEQKALPYRARAPSQSEGHRNYTPSHAHAPYDPSFALDDYIY
ncbi:hypothetical protein FZEAL_10204 [Fusarium zealandicum]|uniref:Uncharacterized protein n=1 Tax=Fusarium zealandicum TaxID=1053134 RepID=A0A8H4XCY2_9HYPO|nr:hypothetical protein FZEAL_10204 [Fusarium zealandicum]